MGQSTAQTVREIEETRDRLEGNLKALEERLPAPATLGKRALGVVVGGGVASTVAVVALKRLGRKRKAAKVAKAAAAIPVIPAVIQVLPDDLVERLRGAFEEGSWKGYLLLGAGAWLAFRLAELRQLRRINQQLMPTVR